MCSKKGLSVLKSIPVRPNRTEITTQYNDELTTKPKLFRDLEFCCFSKKMSLLLLLTSLPAHELMSS